MGRRRETQTGKWCTWRDKGYGKEKGNTDWQVVHRSHLQRSMEARLAPETSLRHSLREACDPKALQITCNILWPLQLLHNQIKSVIYTR